MLDVEPGPIPGVDESRPVPVAELLPVFVESVGTPIPALT